MRRKSLIHLTLDKMVTLFKRQLLIYVIFISILCILTDCTCISTPYKFSPFFVDSKTLGMMMV